MSINQKYTWADFLRKHPDAKAKKLKRTSKEGQKAFEEAFKAHAKAYLKESLVRFDREMKRAILRRDALVVQLKGQKGTPRSKVLQVKVGQKDHAIAALARQSERAKAAQKTV